MKTINTHLFLTLLIILGTLYAANVVMLRNISALLIDEPIDTIILSDSTCTECFDSRGYIQILNRLRMRVGDVNAYDILSPRGAKLVKKYQITKVPALLLSPRAADLSGFEESWREVGTREEDGWFILREVQKVNPGFKEL